MTEKDSDKIDLAPSITTHEASERSQSSQLSPSTASSTRLPVSAKDSSSYSPKIEWFRKHSIPIVGVSLIALLGCLVAHYSSRAIDLTRTKDAADALKNFVEVVAILVGGGWALFRYSKGRTFQESLVAAVSGKLMTISDRSYLVVNIQIKNVGQSLIEFAPAASSLKLFEYNGSPPKEIITVTDNKLTQFDALDDNDRYIEPNEIIEGTRLSPFQARWS
ncbi:MAG: hypothetical protein ABJC05_04125 [Pyrinomonadaceae bacterium]